MLRQWLIARLPWLLAIGPAVACMAAFSRAAELAKWDDATRQQAELEREALAADKQHTLSPTMASFRKTALVVEYPAGELKLPGFLYQPQGDGPWPAILWNHGSEKHPGARAELARFYVEQGYVFFAPIRHGHGRAPGDYVGDLQQEIRRHETDLGSVEQKVVELHELYNHDVVAAVAWLKQQPLVDAQRIVMSGVSYGGIQTVLSAEKGLGIRAFVAFAPGAMSYSNGALRERLATAARNAKAPVFVLQAKNDYSTGPATLLDPILRQNGAPGRAKIYPAFGHTRQQGHGAFACWSLGATIWGEDVLAFIEQAMKRGGP